MATQERIVGCSGCLIEAIEREDEATLRLLLSDPNVEFSDTFWTSRPTYFRSIIVYPGDLSDYPAITSESKKKSEQKFSICKHTALDECLFSGKPQNIAMSVVLSSMANSTKKFNSLQILIESHKFDFSEPLLFHWLYSSHWKLIAADPAAVAILLDRLSTSEYPISFPLLRTLNRYSLLRPDMKFRIVIIEEFWDCLRTNDAFSFLLVCSTNYTFSLRGSALLNKICENYFNWRRDHMTSLLKVLSELRLLHDPIVRPVYMSVKEEYVERYWSSDTGRKKLTHKICSSTLIDALSEMFYFYPFKFDAQSETHVREWICNGWIDPQNEEECLYNLVVCLHNSIEAVRKAAFRISRQLLALGLFRQPERAAEPKLSWPFMCFFQESHGACFYFKCKICTHVYEKEEVCPIVASLMDEFYQKPLTLQQLSRIQIRRSLGMNQFESRVKLLPLPPSLVTYVWRANEMLAIANESSS